MEKIRTFIAIPLPEIVLDEFSKLISIMQPISRSVKWVRPQSIHLTLKFLGNLLPEELERVFYATDNIFQIPRKHFKLTTSKLGAFPNIKKPRVFWVGIQGSGIEELRILHKELESEMQNQGFPKEARGEFSPHLTVARVKLREDLSYLTEKLMGYTFPKHEFRVDKVHVMRSDLKPSGAVYLVQKSYKF